MTLCFVTEGPSWVAVLQATSKSDPRGGSPAPDEDKAYQLGIDKTYSILLRK